MLFVVPYGINVATGSTHLQSNNNNNNIIIIKNNKSSTHANVKSSLCMRYVSIILTINDSLF
jgi:hypothetical protein